MNRHRYPVFRRLGRPMLSLLCCLAGTIFAGKLAFGPYVWLAALGGILMYVNLMLGATARMPGPAPDYDELWVGWAIGCQAMLTAAAALGGVRTAYHHWLGDRVTAVITEDHSGVDHGAQHIGITHPATDDGIGDLHYRSDHDLTTGELVPVLVDPHGWFAVVQAQDTGAVLIPASFGGIGLLGFAVLLGWHIRQDRAFHRQPARTGVATAR